MNPKPLVGLNHFTVPLAIASSPRDQKNNSELPVPANRPCPRRARYAVCGTLDSLNHIGIPAENLNIAAHFVSFAYFEVICSGETMVKYDRFQFLLNRKRGARSLRGHRATSSCSIEFQS